VGGDMSKQFFAGTAIAIVLVVGSAYGQFLDLSANPRAESPSVVEVLAPGGDPLNSAPVYFDLMKVSFKSDEMAPEKSEPLVTRKFAESPTANEVEGRRNLLPKYSGLESQISKESLKEMATETRKQETLKTVKAARAADPKLEKDRSGVVSFAFQKKKTVVKNGKKSVINVKVEDVPRLDIGEEAELSSSDFLVKGYNIPRAQYRSVRRLPSPRVRSLREHAEIRGEWVVAASPDEKIELPMLTSEQKVSLERVEKVSYKIDNEKSVELLAVEEFSEEELKILRAVILAERREKCHFASGLFQDLTQSSHPETKALSNFYLGICLHNMGLFSESVD
jgi:hypothetical protein